MFKETPKKILSLQNPLVKHLVKVRHDPQYRKEHGSVLVSGFKLIEELHATLSPICILSEQAYPRPHIRVSKSVMKKITGLASPEGLAAEFPLPAPSINVQHAPLLVLDRINDPGNMGTLIRTALALDWKGVFFLPGCVDPFHEKVIRASRGALFHLPWQEGEWEMLKTITLKAYTADIKGRSLDQVRPQRDLLLILSNEAQGVSEEGASFGERITIPMGGSVESLNVAIAGAIMMYELGRSI